MFVANLIIMLDTFALERTAIRVHARVFLYTNMATGIYSITINEHLYIGSAKDLCGRKYRHLHSLRKNTHCNIFLQRLYNKYGESNVIFNVVELCDVQDLIAREQFYIDTLNPDINICKVAGSTLGRKHSAETKEKLSKKFKGMQRSLGRVLSDETKKKIGEKNKGHKMSLNTRIALAEYRKIMKPLTAEQIRRNSLARVILSKKQILEIIDLLDKGLTQKEIAKIYGVAKSTIGNIKTRKGIYGEIIDNVGENSRR